MLQIVSIYKDPSKSHSYREKLTWKTNAPMRKTNAQNPLFGRYAINSALMLCKSRASRFSKRRRVDLFRWYCG